MVNLSNKIEGRMIIYPSYSMRDYERLVYLLDSDAEFNQALIEARFLKDYFEEVWMILPEENQRELKTKLPSWLKTVEKKYQVNVGKERFANDVEFFKKLEIVDDDVLYSCFLHKYKMFEEAGINRNKILYTFWHYYPEFKHDFYKSDLLKDTMGIIFRSRKQKNIFIEGLPDFPKDKCFVMRSHTGRIHMKDINLKKFGQKRTVMIPTRLDHEDFNHTWEALSVLLSLKKEIDFNLIICNPNNSGDVSVFQNVAYELGPIPKSRFLEILEDDIGVIYIKKETDYGGTKGAPEYLSSNLIFISNDYEINPWDVKDNKNSQAYSWIKKFLTCDLEEYLKSKRQQIKIAEKYHSDEEVKKVFDSIFKKEEAN